MSGKKIGLLTIHDTMNYGSLLQTFSTYQALTQVCQEVEVIDYECQAIAKREALASLRQRRGLKNVLLFLLNYVPLQKKSKAFRSFMREHLKLSRHYDASTIGNANKDYDTFLVGSDIVWGKNVTGHDMTYFLDFTEADKKRIAFSSSIGTQWDAQTKTEVAPLLKRMDAISVREQLAAQWVEELIGESVPVTCDPTMLLDADFWREQMDTKKVPKEKYVLIYLTTNDKKNIRDGAAYAKAHGMKALYINYGRPHAGVTSVHPDSIEEWLGLVANAQAVFTASYHGLLFGLYFHRNLFYYNRGNTSRMLSLCAELGITHREGTAENIAKNDAIDYEAVDRIMAGKREFSMEYLKKTLK